MISKRAENYGKAFFDVESSKDLLKSLKTLSEVFAEQDIFEFFNSFVIPLEDKKEVFKKIIEKKSNLQNFLFLLLDKQSISLLPEIAQHYENLLNEKEARVKGVVYSSQKLSPSEKESLEKSLRVFLKKKVDLVVRQDTNLKGGLYIKAGDYIFNDTLECHLKKFQSLGG